MPYIKQEKRKTINNVMVELFNTAHTTGEINYAFTKFIHLVVGNRVHYDVLNSMIGVVECCKLELYRMVVAHHEDKKRMENGPVSNLDSKSLKDVR